MLNLTLNRTAFILQPDLTRGSLADVLAHLSDLRDCYPSFDSWLREKVLPGLLLGERSILVEYRDDRLAGFAIVKDDGLEKKLCCLRVLDGFKKTHGMGVRLFERAFEELSTEKPLLSVAEERFPEFSRLFDHFGFEMTKAYDGHYRLGKVEYAFNGLLESPVIENASLLLSQSISAAPLTEQCSNASYKFTPKHS